MYTRVLIFFLVLVSISVVGSFAIQNQFSEYLTKEGLKEFQAGNYLASLVRFFDAQERAVIKPPKEIEKNIEEAKGLLVADVNFKKAKKAAEEGDWLLTKAILAEDPVLINSSFSQYEEAIKLFLEATERVKTLEGKIQGELEQFKEEAVAEKIKRERAEVKIVETKSTLETVLAEKAKSEEALKSEISVREKEAEAAKALAETERLEKFKNELNVYVSLLIKGNGYLGEALKEIGNSKDTTALLFVGQGKALFDEAEAKGKELRDARTPESLKSQTIKLIDAAGFLIEAARRVGNLVFYIGKEKSGDYTALNQEISGLRNSASKLIEELQNFVQ